MTRISASHSKITFISILIAAAVLGTAIAISAMDSGRPVKPYNSAGSINPPQLNYFKIRVIDSATGRGIPLVELRTQDQTLHYTDSAGYLAYYEPGLMDQDVFFHVNSHGYKFNNVVFQAAGKTLKTVSGGEITLKMDRVNIAERLYRITGQGIYSDSVDLGLPVPVDDPVINSDVMGQEHVLTAEYNGSIYWFWNNTMVPDDPKNTVGVSGAVSKLPGRGGLNPYVGIKLDYFTDKNGKVKPLFNIEDDDPERLTLTGLMTITDSTGKEKLVASYEFSDNKGLKGNALERGIVIFDDDKKEFGSRTVLVSNNGKPLNNGWKGPCGQAVKYSDNGKIYYLLAKEYPYSYPVVRVEAKLDAITDLSRYETFSSFKEGTASTDISKLLKKLNDAKKQGQDMKKLDWLDEFFDLDSNGKMVFSWKKNTNPYNQDIEKKLLDFGVIDSSDAYFQLKDKESNEVVVLQEASVRWNKYRNAWVLIGLQQNGTSHSGEVWYAEAPSPTGPWKKATRIITHDNYSFINLSQHSFLEQQGGRIIYIDGTYTAKFTSNYQGIRTPKYDHNQILYRLDLADPRLQDK